MADGLNHEAESSTMAHDKKQYDLVIIGGGPAGYVGAIRASQLGMSVACVERDKLGGVCLNWGCIPTKALLAQAEFYYHLKHGAKDWGITVGDISHDWSKVIGRSRTVAGNLNKGIHGLFKKKKVDHYEGHGKVVQAGPDCVVEVHDEPDHVAMTLEAKNVLVCTGAGPKSLLGADFDGEKIISYKEAMALPKQPKKLLVVGAGAIGMEFAYFYNAFGTEVVVVEMLDRLLPVEDDEISKAIAKAFKKQKIRTLTEHKTMSIEKSGDGIKAVVAPNGDQSKTEEIEADCVLVAIGVEGRFEGVFGEDLDVATYRGHIKVDYRDGDYQTNLDNIWAVGDVIGPPWLAHVASEEAIIAVEQMAGHESHPIDYDAIPGCTYCLPQVASLGKTERALQEEGMKANEDYHVGKFPFQASGKAQALGSTEGFVKILTDTKHGEILGVHMIGENVTELLAQMGLAKRLEATSSEVIATMHAHPTLSEAVHEAALGSEGRMIHF